MNEKFYALPEEKQSQILNAAYKVFATNQYKKAPTSEIAAEAGISKSLLFHYFHNKLELYLFLWKHAADLTKKYMCKYKVYETDDFFAMMRRGLMAKCAVMRKYTFLSLFSINSYFETEPDIQSIIQPDVQDAAKKTLEMLQDAGYVKGAVIREDLTGGKDIDLTDLTISLDGIQFLLENSTMHKIAEFAEKIGLTVAESGGNFLLSKLSK